MDEKMTLFNERFLRYKTVMECGKPDKLPVCVGVGDWVAKYSGYTIQEIFYNIEKCDEAVNNILSELPIDIFGGGPTLWWPPMFDAMGSKLYKFPGIGLDENSTFQYVEEEHMKVEDYDDFIKNPTEWLATNFLPRISKEFENPGSYRATVALIKSSVAFAMFGNVLGGIMGKWIKNHSVVPQVAGITKAPFDTLGDALRSLKGIMLDIHKRPEKVIAACEAIVPHNIKSAFASGGDNLHFPCLVPLHRGAYPFLSPKNWDKFYWPTLKETIEGLWKLGKRVLFFAEGDWTPYLERISELPEQSIIFMIDTTDAKKAKKILGGKFCLQGGVPTTLLTYGTKESIKEYVKKVIEELAIDGGFILSAGGVLMGDAKKENIIAMIEAANEYGKY